MGVVGTLLCVCILVALAWLGSIDLGMNGTTIDNTRMNTDVLTIEFGHSQLGTSYVGQESCVDRRMKLHCVSPLGGVAWQL